MNNTSLDADMSNRATVTFHTSPETKERLVKLAKATRRSSSFLTNEAVERYLAAEEEFVASVQAGITAADAGEVMSGDELRTRLHRHIDTIAAAKKTV
jgi:predicted transcriptional regulator